MGIPKFVGAWVFGKAKVKGSPYHTVRARKVPDTVSSLAIDMNSMIHAAMQIALGYGDHKNEELALAVSKLNKNVVEQRIFDAIIRLLTFTLKEIRPTDTLIIAVDGPTIKAKIQQQRGRRYKTAAQSAESGSTSPDTSIVTPGTNFMIKFDKFFREWIKANPEVFPPTFIYESHLVPGEGEHKIMQLYRDGKVPGDGPHALYGLDADLVMLSLISPQPNIILVREDTTDVINIENLKEALIKSAPGPLKKTTISDFVALMFLLGNDFIPHGPTHDSMFELVELMLNAYYKIKKPLTRKGNDVRVIDFDVYGEIVEEFYEREITLLAREAQTESPDQHPNRFNRLATVKEEGVRGMRTVFDYSIFRTAWYYNAIGEKCTDSQLVEEWVDILPQVEVDDIEQMCVRYIEGIAWCFRYYQDSIVDSRWFYPYHHAPLYMDVAAVLRNKDIILSGEEYDDQFSQGSDLGYGALEQLLAVIPPSSMKASIPGFLHPLVTDIASPIIDLFPTALAIEMDSVPFDVPRFGIALFPFVDMERVIDAIDLLKLPDETFKEWDPHTKIIYIGTDFDNLRYKRETQQILEAREQERERRQAYQQGRGGTSHRGTRGTRGELRGGTYRGTRGARDVSRGGSQESTRGLRGTRSESRGTRGGRGTRGVTRGKRGESQEGTRGESRGGRGGRGVSRVKRGEFQERTRGPRGTRGARGRSPEGRSVSSRTQTIVAGQMSQGRGVIRTIVGNRNHGDELESLM